MAYHSDISKQSYKTILDEFLLPADLRKALCIQVPTKAFQLSGGKGKGLDRAKLRSELNKADGQNKPTIFSMFRATAGR